MGNKKSKFNFKKRGMFLQLNHQQLKVFQASRKFLLECYMICRLFPEYEKYGMVTQFRRAALSQYLNIAEGCSRKSEAERKRFYEIARGSMVEIDAILDSAVDLCYFKKEDLKKLGETMITCFKLLSGML